MLTLKMRRSSLRTVALVLLAAAAFGVSPATPAAPPTLTFHVFARTGHHMDSIVWTGTQFLYVENTANTVWAAPPAGGPIRQFATMPKLVEETRCVLSPGTHGFAPGAIFCASPDNKIYEISADGTSVGVFANLPAPYPPASDGALAFDDVGAFGYRLVAATGRSGVATVSGGTVFAIDSSGAVTKIGGYPGPGGADELVIAPAGFGYAAGDALLVVDPGPSSGTLVAMDASGKTRVIAALPDGPNPIVVIPKTAPRTGKPAPGFYMTHDLSQNVYFAPAAQLAPFAGNVLVGGEARAHFWIVEPHGLGFVKVAVRNNFRDLRFSFEGAIFVP